MRWVGFNDCNHLNNVNVCNGIASLSLDSVVAVIFSSLQIKREHRWREANA